MKLTLMITVLAKKMNTQTNRKGQIDLRKQTFFSLLAIHFIGKTTIY